MHPFLYYGIIITVLIVFAIILWVLRVDPIFLWSFIFLSAVFMSMSVWEFTLPYPATKPGMDYLYLTALWWVTLNIIIWSGLVMYILYQTQFRGWIDWDKTIAYAITLQGTSMVMGVLEDFGVFIIWGVEHLNPIDAPWHAWVPYIEIPWIYLLAIPGAILLVIGFGWAIYHRPIKEALRANVTIQGFLDRGACPPQKQLQCTISGELFGIRGQVCLTKAGRLCFKKDLGDI